MLSRNGPEPPGLSNREKNIILKGAYGTSDGIIHTPDYGKKSDPSLYKKYCTNNWPPKNITNFNEKILFR